MRSLNDCGTLQYQSSPEAVLDRSVAIRNGFAHIGDYLFKWTRRDQLVGLGYAQRIAFVSQRAAYPVLVKAPFDRLRRVSTTLRQVLAKFSEFFICWVFHREISRQDRLETAIGSSVDTPHPRFFASFVLASFPADSSASP